MNVNVLPTWFEPTDEFKQIIGNRTYRDVMFATDVTNYIENHLVMFHERRVCKGRYDVKFRIGFAGCCEVLDVNENKIWIIRYDNADMPYIQYVNINIDNGYVEIIHI